MSLITPDRQWPPRDPPQYAANIARKELWKRVKKYLTKHPQKDDESYHAAVRLLRTKHIGALIGYDVDERRLEVIIYYSIIVRRKFANLADVEIVDDRLPPKAVSMIINNLNPLDQPVLADGLVVDYLTSLEKEEDIAIIHDDDLDDEVFFSLKEQLRLFSKELQRIHADIRNGALKQP